MSKLSLLIADSNEDFLQAFENVFRDSYAVHLCRNGKEALDTACKINPDILILDLMLTELDGITLLHSLRSKNILPVVVVVTGFFTSYVLETAQELGIAYIIRKPCLPSTIAERVKDLEKRMFPSTVSYTDPDVFATGTLNCLQFPAKRRGFDYIRQAILLMYETPDISITKELYPALITSPGESRTQIERAIRCIIGDAWMQSQQDGAQGAAINSVWAKYFRTDANGRVPRPSNGAFIARLALELRIRQGMDPGRCLDYCASVANLPQDILKNQRFL